MNFRAHILRLAKQRRVGIRLVNEAAGCWPRARIIWIFPVLTREDYAVALHELGHLFTTEIQTRYLKELRAWDWAKRNALVWSSSMEGRRRNALFLWQQRLKSTVHCAT